MIIVSLMHYCGKVNQYSLEKKGKINQMSVFIDEANSLLFDKYYELISKARSSKVELTTVVQSLSDFDLINPHIGRQVRENSKLHFYMRQTEESSTDIIAGNLSTNLTTKVTRQLDKNSPTDLASVRDVHEFNLHPSILKNLKTGQAIMRTAGEKRIHALHAKQFLRIEQIDMSQFETKENKIASPKDKKQKKEQTNSKIGVMNKEKK